MIYFLNNIIQLLFSIWQGTTTSTK